MVIGYNKQPYFIIEYSKWIFIEIQLLLVFWFENIIIYSSKNLNLFVWKIEKYWWNYNVFIEDALDWC